MTELVVPDWREEHRYGVYAVRDEECPDCEGRGYDLAGGFHGMGAPIAPCQHCAGQGRRFQPVLVCCADSKEAVGVALIAQGEDAIEAGTAVESLGVLDGQTGKWLAHPCWAVGRGGHV